MKGLRQRLQEQVAAGQSDEADATLLRDYYQSVLDSVGSVVYTVDRELRVTGVNRAWDDFARAHGRGGEHLTGERVLGSPLLAQMQGAPLQRWRSICRRILDGELPRYLDEVVAREATDWRHYSLSATPLRDGAGQILGITFVATNITQLKKAEHEMFQRLVQIRGLEQVAQTTGSWGDRRRVYKRVTADIAQLFDAAKCVIFLWDEKSGHLQAQDPAFGLPGRNLAELHLDMGHPADPDSLWLDLEEKDFILLNEGDEAPADVIETSARVDRLAAMLGILRVSGRLHGAILVAGRDQPFSEQDGQLLALFAVPTALSIENAELNRRLLDRTQQLSSTRHELDRMIRMQEAIRMPLSVLQGYLELFIDGTMGPVPDAQLSTLQMLLTKGKAIIGLVNRIVPQRFPLDAQRYEKVYLSELIRTALDRHRSLLRRAGTELNVELPEAHSPSSATLGDPDMLFKVFDALLDNAVKHNPGGGRLSLSLHVSQDIVYVKVDDSGVGIPPDRLTSIWRGRRRNGSSRSISLPEVKRIVEGHGGQVWAESTPDQGSAFHVVLRRIDPHHPLARGNG